MKRFVARILQAFTSVKPVPSRPPMGEARRTGIRYIRGNILLQSGRVTTPEEYERQKRRVLDHAF